MTLGKTSLISSLMRDHETALLKEIESFIAEQGMSETRFGVEAVNDCHLIKRLRNRSVTLRTVQKIQDFMARLRAQIAE